MPTNSNTGKEARILALKAGNASHLFSAGHSPSRARSNRQWVGYFIYKRLASTGGKVAASSGQLPTGKRRFFRDEYSGSKSEKEFKYSGNSETLPQARCDRHEVRQLRCWR